MQELHDILSILKNPGNPVDSFTRTSFSGPMLLSTKSVSIRKFQLSQPAKRVVFQSFQTRSQPFAGAAPPGTRTSAAASPSAATSRASRRNITA